jgi:hypothetical protein
MTILRAQIKECEEIVQIAGIKEIGNICKDLVRKTEGCRLVRISRLLSEEKP